MLELPALLTAEGLYLHVRQSFKQTRAAQVMEGSWTKSHEYAKSLFPSCN